MRKLTTKDFIKRAKKLHGNIYDYSRTVYTRSKNKVQIICRVHGVFEQLANSHLQGYGCNKCAIAYRANLERQSKEEYVNKANKRHNNFYDYSKLEYIDVHHKGIITCPLHGDFTQKLNSHLAGQGCRECSKNRLGNSYSAYKNKKTILYLLEFEDGLYKIGITRRKTVFIRYYGDTNKKFIVLFQTSFFNGAEAISIEQAILKEYHQYIYRGSKKLFKRTKNYEVLSKNPIESLVRYVKDLNKVPLSSN